MLLQVLADKRSTILQRWLALILESYPPAVARFLRTERDRFANPVGSTIAHELETIYDGLRAEAAVDTLAPALEAIVKIRAVQDFSASQAVAFVLQLKQAVREALADELAAKRLPEGLLALESRIDSIAARAFDIYMQARERISELRANELRRRTELLLARLSRGEPSEDAS
jgi:hypothetical protein